MPFPSANILTKALLDQMSDVAFIKDQNRRYIYGNNAFAVLMGKPLTDIIGFDDSTLFPPEFTQKFWKMDDQVLTSGEQMTFEEEVMTASGEVILMMTKKMRIEIEGKYYLLGVTRDVTEFNKTLHLNQMSKLSSGLAHELLTPLTVMNFNIHKASDLMQKEAFDKTAAENFLTKMKIVEKRLTDTVQAVQAFAVQARVQPTVRKNLCELLEEVRELVDPRLKTRQVQMHEFSALPVEILSRGTQISQVLVNLIHNAADAVSTLPERWVELEFKRLHGCVEIRVIDSGNGIPPEIAKKLMEPFFTTKTGGAGTGLGFSLAARIVADHHGELFYDANAPHTTFVLRLPLAA